MRQLILIAQTSLDGYVAGTKGEFDNFIGGEENLGFVCSVIKSADAILAGRISYQLLDSHWPTAYNKPGATQNEIIYSNWYNEAAKTVLSKSLQAKDLPGATVIKENIPAEVTKLKQQPGKDILIFGSPTTVHSLLELDLIDATWLIVHPVLFGQGILLFRRTKKITRFILEETKPLSNGTLCNKYSIAH